MKMAPRTALEHLPWAVDASVEVMSGRKADHTAAERQGRAYQANHGASEHSAHQSIAVLVHPPSCSAHSSTPFVPCQHGGTGGNSQKEWETSWVKPVPRIEPSGCRLAQAALSTQLPLLPSLSWPERGSRDGDEGGDARCGCLLAPAAEIQDHREDYLDRHDFERE